MNEFKNTTYWKRILIARGTYTLEYLKYKIEDKNIILNFQNKTVLIARESKTTFQMADEKLKILFENGRHKNIVEKIYNYYF